MGGPTPWSSSTATAMATGFKTDLDNLAWLPGDPPDGALETSAEALRRLYGMSIGYVTTGPFPHATPGGWFAHDTNRFDYWPIAHQILTQLKPDVVVGGGTAASGYADPADLDAVKSSGEYLTVERAPGVDGSMALLAGTVMANQQQKKLLGLFGDTSANFEHPIPLDSPGSPGFTRPSVEDPTMAAASIAALEVLSRNPNGFFLLLEQEDIDLANHANDFRSMVGCVYDLDQAVRAVLDFIDRPDDAVDWTNTTVIVTADHANSYMRLLQTLDRGDLPTQAGTSYPDGEISYATGGHTNELTTVYARGLGATNLTSYANVYPGLNILDDTSIYHATLEAARR
jgi:alkaline phosphatase